MDTNTHSTKVARTDGYSMPTKAWKLVLEFVLMSEERYAKKITGRINDLILKEIVALKNNPRIALGFPPEPFVIRLAVKLHKDLSDQYYLFRKNNWSLHFSLTHDDKTLFCTFSGATYSITYIDF